MGIEQFKLKTPASEQFEKVDTVPLARPESAEKPTAETVESFMANLDDRKRADMEGLLTKAGMQLDSPELAYLRPADFSILQTCLDTPAFGRDGQKTKERKQAESNMQAVLLNTGERYYEEAA